MKRILLACLTLLVLALGGCGDKRSPTGSQSGKSTQSKAGGAMNNDMFTFTIDSLNRLEQFQTEAVQGEITARIIDIEKRLAVGAPASSESTLLAAWPETDSMRQIVDRLNQWIHNQKPPDWKLDPMTAKLPDPLKNLPMVAGLKKLELDLFDGYYLQEAVYLRDVALAARGKSIDDLTRVNRLFDWTVRNIQLDADSPQRAPQFPWEALFFGHGTALERAWVFMLLARQQDLDAAVLAIEKRAENSKADEKKGEDQKAEDNPAAETKTANKIEEYKVADKKSEKASPDGDGPVMRTWCVAVRIEGKAYLFDTAWGMPIPGPDGLKKGQSGELNIVPATLEQLSADPSLLTRMNADAEHPYGVAPEDLKRVTAFVEASPAALSRRMKTIESHLQGKQKMVLTASAAEQAERWKATPGITDVGLWQLPFETVQRRSELKPLQIIQRLTSFLPFYVMPTMLLQLDDVLKKAAETPPDKRDVYKGSATGGSGKGSQSPVDVIPDTDADKNRRIIAELNRLGTAFAAPLYKGRVLQLKGEISGEVSAMSYFLKSMPSNDELQIIQQKMIEQFLAQVMEQKKIAPAEREKLIKDLVEAVVTGKKFKNQENQRFADEVRQRFGPILVEQLALIVRGKQDAAYWLGLVTYERANYPAAYNYFGKFTLDAWPNGPWTVGANYNLARALEAGGEIEAADKIYRANRDAPDFAGQRLRAKWLAEVNAPSPKDGGQQPEKAEENP